MKTLLIILVLCAAKSNSAQRIPDELFLDFVADSTISITCENCYLISELNGNQYMLSPRVDVEDFECKLTIQYNGKSSVLIVHFDAKSIGETIYVPPFNSKKLKGTRHLHIEGEDFKSGVINDIWYNKIYLNKLKRK